MYPWEAEEDIVIQILRCSINLEYTFTIIDNTFILSSLLLLYNIFFLVSRDRNKALFILQFSVLDIYKNIINDFCHGWVWV